MRYFILSILLFIQTYLLPAQAIKSHEVRGKVSVLVDNKKIPLADARVAWIDTEVSTRTNSDGEFSLDSIKISDTRLVVTKEFYESDTVHVSGEKNIEIVLKKIHEVRAMEVSADKPASYIAPFDIKTEVITQKELEKAPCCDLSGCFSTNSSVEPTVTDVITDTKELRMIGLAGVYTQILLDNIPSLMSGLNYSTGLSFIPGSLIDRIYIVKGITSVIQGYDCISGQINVLMKESDESDRLFINAYTNSFLEKQFNLSAAQSFNKWSAIIAAHSIQRANKIDVDGNSFLDVPQTTRYSFYNKWKYLDEDNGVLSNSAVKYTYEQKVGGQNGFDPSIHKGSDVYYGQILKIKQLEVYNKTEILSGEESKFNIHAAASTHVLDSYYGTTKYDAEQLSLYGDAYYYFSIAEDNDLKTGLSYRYNKIDEEIRFLKNPFSKSYSGANVFIESVSGIFAENSLKLFEDAFTLISGLRFDYHNNYGLITTPRLFLKYSPDIETTVRASIGTGFHVPYIFIENSSLLASSRDVIIKNDLQPEKAVNFGLSLTHNYSIESIQGSLSIDAYRTVFSNQVIADYDIDALLPNPSLPKIVFENLGGTSVSNNLLIELRNDFSKSLNIKAAYTFSDVFEKLNGSVKYLPFISKHKILATLSYELIESGWKFNSSYEWHGSQLLPNTSAYPVEFQLPSYSDPYSLFTIQITKAFDHFEFYGGIENIFDTRQENPIINAKNPFDKYFEPTFIWGPVKGREFFLGLRIRILSLVDQE